MDRLGSKVMAGDHRPSLGDHLEMLFFVFFMIVK
jgi:hypothetical protein